MDQQEIPELLTIPHVARRLGVSPAALKTAIASGKLQAIRLNEKGWPRLTETEVMRWLAARAEPAP